MKKWKSLNSAVIKRILSCTLAVGLTATAISVSTFGSAAGEAVKLDTANSLTVSAPVIDANETNKDFVEDLQSANVDVDIYLVATAEKRQGVDGYDFNVDQSYQISIPEDVTDKEWVEIAEQAATVALNTEAISPAKTIKLGETASDLTAGLYLVIPRGTKMSDGTTDIDNYFETITSQDLVDGVVTPTSKLVTIAYSQYYKYSFMPQLVALPTKAADENGVINTAADSEWLYSASLYIKGERESLPGKLQIIKDLLVYEATEPATFVFNVEAKLNDRVVYSNVHTFTFTSAKEQFLVVEDIPSGAVVTVTEVYSGCNYEFVSAVNGDGTASANNTATAMITANDMVTVRFANTYNWNDKHCGAFTNHFDPVKNDDGTYKVDANGNYVYDWTKYGDVVEGSR